MTYIISIAMDLNKDIEKKIWSKISLCEKKQKKLANKIGLNG